MILIIGPLFNGKKTFCRQTFHLSEQDFSKSFPCTESAIYEAQELAAGKDLIALNRLADALAEKPYVLFTETGSGVVPIDPVERENRENAGILGQLLAQRADAVIRVWCGLPVLIKGKLPE